jgi:hypothetical protein
MLVNEHACVHEGQLSYMSELQFSVKSFSDAWQQKI